jgi:acyl carrier protein
LGNLYKLSGMTENQLLEELQQVFKQVFDDPELVISSETTMDDIPAWDSLHNVMIIDKMEQKFHVKFELDDMFDMNSVGAIMQKIISKKR